MEIKVERYLIFYILICVCYCEEVCTMGSKTKCGITQFSPRYLLYDVNPSEGFNLRRDVYMRLAVFMRYLTLHSHNWKLVLPPWNHLYHWRTREGGEEKIIPWKQFFDLESLQSFAPVIEMEDFVQDVGTELDNVYFLQHYKGAFTTNWNWVDKWSFEECRGETNWSYIKDEERYMGWFWGFKNLTAKEVKCVSFQGGASLLSQLLDSSEARSNVIHHAEIVLHDNFGDKTYWECRRSMRFAKHLVHKANYFRKKYLNSTNILDSIVIPHKWEDLMIKRDKAKGGPYLCAHLRRRDFLFGRASQVPSLEYAADQIVEKLESLKLILVFLSTDAPQEEIDYLKRLINTSYSLVHYKPDANELEKFQDGGIAIIDQIICSHARYFMGTHESTFSFRIQEEREILGFPIETTFNRFCGSDKGCPDPSKWKIVL